jgi:hypothetical protein
MYTFEREATFKTIADMMRGLPITAQIVKYYKEAAGIDIQVQRALTGSPVCVRFVSQLESLDEWQKVQEKVAQDPAFHKLLGELAPMVDGSRTNDRIWRA